MTPQHPWSAGALAAAEQGVRAELCLQSCGSTAAAISAHSASQQQGKAQVPRDVAIPSSNPGGIRTHLQVGAKGQPNFDVFYFLESKMRNFIFPGFPS